MTGYYNARNPLYRRAGARACAHVDFRARRRTRARVRTLASAGGGGREMRAWGVVLWFMLAGGGRRVVWVRAGVVLWFTKP